jgi:hypothetical protein
MLISRDLLALLTHCRRTQLSEWIASCGLVPRMFGTHSLRRTKATMIYKRTGNLHAAQLLLGQNKI